MSTTVTNFPDPGMCCDLQTPYYIIVQNYASIPLIIVNIIFAIIMFLNILYTIVQDRQKDIVKEPSPYPKLGAAVDTGYNDQSREGLF
jgi:hypothetical protein